MITARIKIGSGSIVDTQNYGLVYLDSDKRVGAPTKGFEATSYPEEEGEHILAKTVDAAFDYKVKFFIQATSVQSVNAKIKAFNDMILPLGSGSGSGSGERTAQLVEFYNDYKRHKIVGYAQPMAEAEDFWRDPKNQVNDVAVVELTIRVTKPSLCDFALTAGSGSGSGNGA